MRTMNVYEDIATSQPGTQNIFDDYNHQRQINDTSTTQIQTHPFPPYNRAPLFSAPKVLTNPHANSPNGPICTA